MNDDAGFHQWRVGASQPFSVQYVRGGPLAALRALAGGELVPLLVEREPVPLRRKRGFEVMTTGMDRVFLRCLCCVDMFYAPL